VDEKECMKIGRQWFRPGRRIEQIGRLARQPFFTRRKPDDPTEPPDAPSQLKRSRGLPALAENMGAIFSISISLVLVLAIAALVFAFVKEIRREAIYLDPIDVPEDLAKRGFSADVVTERLLDHVRAIQAAANTSKPSQGVDSSATQVDIQVPGGQLSMKSIVRYARSLFDLPEQHFTGEITREDATFSLLLRVRDRRRVTVVAEGLSATNVDALLKLGGEALVRATDPYVLASYYFLLEEKGLRYERTLATINYVLTHPPQSDDVWAWNLWGLVLERQGKREEAIVKYRRSIAADPAVSPAYVNLVGALIDSGKREEAAQLLNEAVSKVRASPMLMRRMGDSYQQLRKPALALDMYRRVLEIDPDNYDVRAQVGGMQWRLRHYDEAEKLLKETIDRSPNIDAHLFYLGVLLERGDNASAREIADRIQALAPTGPYAAMADAFYRLFNDDPTGAAEKFQAAIDNGFGGVPFAWWGLGRALAASGDTNGALEKFDRALALDPQNAEALTDSASVLASVGRGDEANARFAAAVKADPEYARAWSEWSKVLAANGRNEDAAAKRAQAEVLAKRQGVKL
jgi:tetratricopeptide (TPR) repeat protein